MSCQSMNSGICKHCRKTRMKPFTQEDEIRWQSGVVDCRINRVEAGRIDPALSKMHISGFIAETTRDVDGEPPAWCPYLTEHVVSEEL